MLLGMRFNMFAFVFMALLAASVFSSGSITPVQGVQETAQKDSAVITRLPSWGATGSITYMRMWGSPMYVKRAVNSTKSFAGPCETYTEGNKTKYSCITKALGKGGTFPIGLPPNLNVYDLASGRKEQCEQGSTRCLNTTFERCVGGFWVSAEQCGTREACTQAGCRITGMRYRQKTYGQRDIAAKGYIYNANVQISGGFV